MSSLTLTTYDLLGRDYTRHRRPDPRIASRLRAALGRARSVLNVGAGAGAYEPGDRPTIAVDPSAVMLAQRASGAAPAVQALAEALPCAARTVDAVLAVLTLHHWRDQKTGLAECMRVARQRVVLFTWDPDSAGFWLVQDYLPELMVLDRTQFPSMQTLVSATGRDARVAVTPVPIPHDCEDGFLGAYWRRPKAYLDASVRAGISSFARVPDAEARLQTLRADLDSGAWEKRYGTLLARDELDLGYRLVIVDLPTVQPNVHCS